MKIPKVFISYSHDSQEHKKWILEMATRMRNNGIDAIIDQWELKPGDDLPHFMESNLASADKVIMVCTENYVSKANSGTGGVGYEKMIITSNYLKKIDANKVIPIIRQNAERNVPTFLTSKLYIDFTSEGNFEFGFDELIRTIHGSPLYVKPEIGNNPFKEVNESDSIKVNSGLTNVMSAMAKAYNSGRSADKWIYYTSLANSFNGSKILLDTFLDEAKALGYVKTGTFGASSIVFLEAKGRKFILDNNLDKDSTDYLPF